MSGAHVPEGPDTRHTPTGSDVRAAVPVEGAHDTYERGEPGSIGGLVADISRDISTLMRQEVALAKAEVQQSAKEAGKGAGMLAGAGVAAHMMLLFLSLALWWGLGHLLNNHGYAALAVGLLWGIIAAILAAAGKSAMQNVNGIPRTVETAKQVPDALKGNEDIR